MEQKNLGSRSQLLLMFWTNSLVSQTSRMLIIDILT